MDLRRIVLHCVGKKKLILGSMDEFIKNEKRIKSVNFILFVEFYH
jgi:hypothetical protein